MSTLKLVKELRAKHKGEDEIQWGSYDVLNNIKVKKLSRKELKLHLQARNLPINGGKGILVKRLEESLQEERLEMQAFKEAEDIKFRRQARREEDGAVFTVGSNGAGQLGVGDTETHQVFTVIPMTRGRRVRYVAAADTVAFMVTEVSEVFVWGGATSADAINLNKAERKLEPMPANGLMGEDVVQMSLGASHGVAISEAGDVFVWGHGGCGQLGNGEVSIQDKVKLLHTLPHGTVIRQAACGENHTLVLSDQGRVYAWGHGGEGRLGVGQCERLGVEGAAKAYFPTPALIGRLNKVKIRQVSCGASHCLALADEDIYSWGCGNGGRLGHGDTNTYDVPRAIEALHGECVLQVVCGTWHSAALVIWPPLTVGGVVYTWGSGYHGQLAQLDTQVALEPAPVEYFLDFHLPVRFVSCGPYHCAAITVDQELYTWGSNMHGCLGRVIDDEEGNDYTPLPGHVGGFGAIVGEIGRGLVRSVACGRHFTVVATYPYKGPTLEVAEKIMEDMELREKENKQAEEEKDDDEGSISISEERVIVAFICSKCDYCTGYKLNLLRAGICASCGHHKLLHTIEPPNDPPEPATMQIIQQEEKTPEKKKHAYIL
mmetsp:Transcript_1477/g.2016  ORF Transcript_1477/g.2016 Transcript_1477/m.2016 type:complete len:602 (-) Transcript_1477:2-1807(-)|eukprot:CAMPEP_0117750804 /NCGR_PEP_ID=MMETSP0947-20121206/10599_1 /TAXON_ID=44440 /ORGANISM="Chattonella subsalsa, Strain CCMP2191" /LENGTH=601 /DNA_ID=CAMNT_0005569067 /DNA_START=233 /DNA_END=2038 /DNA_ORIENTATION=-